MRQTFQALSVDLKRAFGSIGFFLAVVGVWVVFYAGARSEMKYAKDVLYLFKYSTGASGFNSILTLFCVLPYTTSFCSDWISKYIRPVVVRTGSHRYALIKTISCALSSGIAVSLGIVFFILPLTIRIPLVSTASPNFSSFVKHSLGGELLLSGQYIAFFAIYIYLAFLAGAFWSVAGLCASAFIPNKFVALFTPYIGLYVLNLTTHNFPVWLRLYKVTSGDCIIGGTVTSLIYATLFVVVLTAGVGFIFFKTVKKRLSNE